jgi:hypothetical protein
MAVNRNQNLLGKTMLVANRSVESVTALKPDEWSDLLHQITRVTAALDELFNPAQDNHAFLMNYQSSCIHRELIGTLGAQAEYLRVPLADRTLVATPDVPADDLIPGSWPPPTCWAPAGSAPWPPR